MKRYYPIVAAVCFMLGLLFASGGDENILQGTIALALIGTSAYLVLRHGRKADTAGTKPINLKKAA